MSQNGFRIFHCAAAAPDCLGKADRSPDGGRLGQVGKDQAIAGAVKPQGDAGGNVPGSPNNDKHSVTPLRIGWRSFPGGCRMGDHVSDCPAARQLCSSVWRMLPSKSLPRWSMYSSASYFIQRPFVQQLDERQPNGVFGMLGHVFPPRVFRYYTDILYTKWPVHFKYQFARL